MSLPNPSMDAVPLTTLPAEFLDDMIENIEALSAGTGLNDGSITPAKLSSGSGTSWVWQNYTPTLTNITLGNGTLVAKYVKIGKTVHFRITLVFGSTTTIGSGDTYINFPVTATSDYIQYQPLGNLMLFDTGSTLYVGMVSWDTASRMILIAQSVGGTYGATAIVNNTSPANWGVGDKFMLTGTYEAA